MLSQNIFPLGKPSATSHFLGKITAQSAAGQSAQWMSDVFLQSRTSSIAQGFENAAPAWPVQAKALRSPALCFIRVDPRNPRFLLVTLRAS
jgi:hypothetical protein